VTPRVLNKHTYKKAGAVYVGRPSKWGNPYTIGLDGTRAEVIAKYAADLKAGRLPITVEDLESLRGQNLLCWCAPLPCHADVLLEIANAPD
jgi:hypothetical protein